MDSKWKAAFGFKMEITIPGFEMETTIPGIRNRRNSLKGSFKFLRTNKLTFHQKKELNPADKTISSTYQIDLEQGPRTLHNVDHMLLGPRRLRHHHQMSTNHVASSSKQAHMSLQLKSNKFCLLSCLPQARREETHRTKLPGPGPSENMCLFEQVFEWLQHSFEIVRNFSWQNH